MAVLSMALLHCPLQFNSPGTRSCVPTMDSSLNFDGMSTQLFHIAHCIFISPGTHYLALPTMDSSLNGSELSIGHRYMKAGALLLVGTLLLVMEQEYRKFSISYWCLLKQLLEHLGFPQPVYEVVDMSKNHVRLLVVTTDVGPYTYTYDGDAAPKFQASCERAAEEAVRGLRMEYNICINDLTSAKIRMYKCCENLLNLKRHALESKERVVRKPSLSSSDVLPTRTNTADVVINYLDMLHVLTVKKQAHVSPVEPLMLTPQGYVAWLTVYFPGDTAGMECIIDDRCLSEASAKQNAALKAVSFLQCKYRLEIVDLNYGLEKNAGIKCSFARESFMATQEGVLGVQGALNLAPFLNEEDCSTPRSLCNKIPTPSLPPAAPHNPNF